VYKTVAFMTFACWALLTAGIIGQGSASAPARPSLDYEYFKTKVQPIFLKKRPGRAAAGEAAYPGRGTQHSVRDPARVRRFACSRSTRARRPGPTKSRGRISMWFAASWCQVA